MSGPGAKSVLEGNSLENDVSDGSVSRTFVIHILILGFSMQFICIKVILVLCTI